MNLFLFYAFSFCRKNLNFSYSTLTQPVGKLSEVEKKKRIGIERNVSVFVSPIKRLNLLHRKFDY